MRKGGAVSPAAPVPAGARVDGPQTCDHNASAQEGCTCSEVTLLDIDFLNNDCGYCTFCSTNHTLEPQGELACVREKENSLTPTMVGDESDDIASAIIYLFVDILPDGTESAFEILETTDNNGTMKEYLTMNGIACDIDETSCIFDCTNVPGIDVAVDVCESSLADVPKEFTFWVYDYRDFEQECMDAFGEVVINTIIGDPHIETFDGLQYDCQGHGEFILVTSSDGSLEIQGRFEEPAGASGQTSVMTGLAIEYEGNTVEIVIDDPTSADCAATDSSSMFTVTETMEEIIIKYPDSFLEVVLNRRKSDTFGCFWSAVIVLPVSTEVTYMGLYGSPDGDATNDWTQQDGTVITQPTDANQLLFQTAYDYCTDNWCITTEGDSLFSHGAGEFDALNGCSVPYNNDIETAFNAASDSLKALCGDDVGCLVDGSLGDESDAAGVLEDTKEFEEVIEEVEEVAQDPEDVQEDIIDEQESDDDSSRCGLFCRFTCGVIGG